MYFLFVFYFCFYILTEINSYPVTYEKLRGKPYTVNYDHRAITINGSRTMLISGCIHYPRSTPQMWPYIMQMAKNQGLNTIQTYVFWNLHEPKQGTYIFNERANLTLFLQEAANAGLFVNLRIGPYISGEWNNGGLPIWLNQIPNISFRSSNEQWKTLMRQFVLDIVDYVTPYLAKNGGPIILAQIENEYAQGDQAYVDWCGSLVSNELASTEVPWIMCNGASANSTIETCNSCNCLTDGWIDQHRKQYPSQPLLFTENEGWFQTWGQAFAIRTASDLSYSVASWFAAGGAYHAYYMWYGGTNYGLTAASGVTPAYADDVCLHADATPNEPKYSHLSRLQHLIAQYAEVLLSQDASRVLLPWWDGSTWANGTYQNLYSYPPSIHFIINRAPNPVNTLFHHLNITMETESVHIYDDQLNLLWNSADYRDIPSNISEILPIITGPLQWQTWSESTAKSNLSVVRSLNPLEQLNITNEDTAYMWYRRNITLKQPSATSIVRVQTCTANGLLFFLDGKFIGEFDNHIHDKQDFVETSIVVDLSHYETNRPYLFEVLSISFGLFSGVYTNTFHRKGIVGNLWIDNDLLANDSSNVWEHQKGLVGEFYQIYTQTGASKFHWNSNWTNAINQPITWFQVKFDLDHLISQDIVANPVLLDAQGLNRGHAFINGHDIGLYWLIQGICSDTPCCCQQAQINCLQPTQRYYHIPKDWLMPANNLLTIFDDLGASAPQSVGFVQRVVTK